MSEENKFSDLFYVFSQGLRGGGLQVGLFFTSNSFLGRLKVVCTEEVCIDEPVDSVQPANTK